MKIKVDSIKHLVSDVQALIARGSDVNEIQECLLGDLIDRLSNELHNKKTDNPSLDEKQSYIDSIEHYKQNLMSALQNSDEELKNLLASVDFNAVGRSLSEAFDELPEHSLNDCFNGFADSLKAPQKRVGGEALTAQHNSTSASGGSERTSHSADASETFAATNRNRR